MVSDKTYFKTTTNFDSDQAKQSQQHNSKKSLQAILRKTNGCISTRSPGQTGEGDRILTGGAAGFEVSIAANLGVKFSTK